MEDNQDRSGDTLNLAARLGSLSLEKRALLEKRLRTLSESRGLPDRISPRLRTRRPPLSFAQLRLWFLAQLEPGHAFYNLPLAMRFRGTQVKQALEAALNKIIQRHEALRTTFVLEDGEPAQEIAGDLTLALENVDLSRIPRDEREAETKRLAQAEAMRPFDLAKGPLIRAKLFQVAENDQLLVVTMHHIIADGWSLGVFAQELNAFYKASDSGETASVPPLPMQYADFAIWQRDHLQGANLERLLAYWRRKLDGLPALLELPTDGPRPRVQSFDGGSLVRCYGAETLGPFKELASTQGATLYMALLAIFKVLLHRFSGLSDIVVGSPIANRSRVETEGLIGLFANTLVLRTDFSGEPTFLEILSRIKTTTIEAYAHQDLPFERLVEELSPDRNLSHNPLFQIMFGLQNTERDIPNENVESDFCAGTSKFDLTLNVIETNQGVTCVFEFSTAIFRPETIDSLAVAFGVLMRSATAAPDRRISELPLISATQRAALISEAATTDSQPATFIVHEWFEHIAANRPNAIAVSAGDVSFSYSEIDKRANQLARALRDKGAGPEAIVGVCLDRTPELLVAVLGVLKAGAAFLPIDPAQPKDRLAFMISDAKAQIVLTDAKTQNILPAFNGNVWRMDRDWRCFSDQLSAPLSSPALPDNLCYVIYTSGSTGRPKGVMVSHRSAANAAQTLLEIFHLPTNARVFQFGSLSFDIFIFDLLMVMSCGGTLCLAASEVMPGQPLADALRNQRINVVTLPPSSLSVVPKTALPDLHTIVCGGETLPGDLALRWASGRRLINGYGPTETTIWATYFQCSELEANPAIGRAVPNVQVYLLDQMGEPLPCGFPGEIYIAGAGVARGYLNQPATTAERYLPCPFSAELGARMYRTGDRARRLSTGDLQFMARLDQQVKLRGYRIELGEIEAILSGHPKVREGVVVLQHTQGGEKRIAAYCTLHEGGATDRDELIAYLRQQLPEYMVPTRVRLVDALPLSVNGKVDRRKLAFISDAEDQSSTEAPPNTEVERGVLKIYADILETKNVGPRSNFFDLGGHSLLATRAVIRINEAFKINLTLRELFEFPVVADMAAAIERARDGDGSATAPPITKADRMAVPFPLARPEE